jgi:hypothetical protein
MGLINIVPRRVRVCSGDHDHSHFAIIPAPDSRTGQNP